MSAQTLPVGDKRLTPRQREMVRLMARGLPYAQIAAEMNLSLFTIKNYAERIFERLGVYSRAGAVGVALRAGLLD